MRFFLSVVFLTAMAVITGPFSLQALAARSLDSAVQECAKYLEGRFPKGTRAALVAVSGENQEIGEFVHRKLSGVLVNSGWFTVVERSAAALETIAREMDRHLNFEVSQETELSIGKQLGAEIIISGSVTRSGQNWRLDVHATTVETARRAAQWSGANIVPDPSWASLASPRSAGLSFAGDTLSERDRRTVTDSLRNTMQARNIALELDENAAGVPAGGYVFTVTVYREQLPPAPPANTVLLQSEVTVFFSRGGRTLAQAGPYNITEMSEAMTARRIAERLAADRVFFDRVAETAR